MKKALDLLILNLKIMGIEAVKSSHHKFVEVKLKRQSKIIMGKTEQSDLHKFIADFKKEFLSNYHQKQLLFLEVVIT